MKNNSKKKVSLFVAFAICLNVFTAPGFSMVATAVETPVSQKITLTPDMIHDEEIAYYTAHYFHSAKILANDQDKLPLTPLSKGCTGNSLNLSYVNQQDDTYIATFNDKFAPYFYIDLGAYYRVTNVLVCRSYGNDIAGAIYLGEHFNWTKMADIDLSLGLGAQPYDTSSYTKPVRFVRLNGGLRTMVEVGIYGYKVSELTEKDAVHDQPSVYKGTSDNLTVGQAIGANIFINNQMDNIEQLGNAREFHNLAFSVDDNGKNCFSPSAPSNNSQWDFDKFYGTLHEKGVNVIPCLQLTHPWIYGDYKELNQDGVMVGFDYNVDRCNSPSYGGIATESAKDYEKHANILYNYAARYGSNKNIDPSTLRLADNQQVKTGLGYLDTIENGNEQNANWWADTRKSYMTPYEMAAQTSADYDGHEFTIPNAGVKAADPNMKLAQAGMVGGNALPYLDGMKRWFSYNRSDSYFAMDVINYHCYTLKSDFEGLDAKYLGAPEKAQMIRTNTKDLRNWIDTNAPGRDFWISEFNVYTDDLISPEYAKSINRNHDKRFQTGAAQRLARALLVMQRDGADRISMFELRNEASGAFADMGLVWEYGNETKKLSWYYVSMLQETLKNADLIDVYESDNVYKYTYQDRNTSEITYAIWSPTTDGSTIPNYIMPVSPGSEKAERIVPEYGYSEGLKSSLDIENNSVKLDVTEKVQFVKVSGSDVPRDNYTMKRIGIDRIQLGTLSSGGTKVVYDGSEIINVAKGQKPVDPMLSELYKMFDEQEGMPLSTYDNQIIEYTHDFLAAPKSICKLNIPYEIGEFPYDLLVAFDDVYTITGIMWFDGEGRGDLDIYDDVTGQLIQTVDLLKTNLGVIDLKNTMSTNRIRLVKHNAAHIGELMFYGYKANSKVGLDVPPVPGELFVLDASKVSVSFDSQGGSAILPMRGLEPGSVITLPRKPTKTGYVFGGWYTDKNFAVAFNAREPITSNIVLYAKWLEKGTYTQIALYPQMVIAGATGDTLVDEQNCLGVGGKGASSFGYDPSVTIDMGRLYAIDQISFLDERNAGAAKIYGSVDGVTWDLMVEDGLDGYFVWKDFLLNGKQIRYLKMEKNAIVLELLVFGAPVGTVTDTLTLTFNSTGGNALEPLTGCAYGSITGLPTPERYGYRFDGWYTLPAPKTFTEFTNETPITYNATLYAKWVPTVTFTVQFSSGTGTVIAPIKGVGYGNTISVSAPVKEGYAFLGWYKDGAYQQPFDLETGTITQDTTLYAKWGKQLMLTADMFLSGNSAASLVDAQTGSGYGQQITADVANANPYLLDLGGNRRVIGVIVWSGSSSKGSSVTIDAGLEAGSLTRVVSSSIQGNENKSSYKMDVNCRYLSIKLHHNMREIYVLTEPAVGTVAFDLNGGVGTVPDVSRYCEGIDINLPTDTGLTRKDYHFLGWARNPGATAAQPKIVSDGTAMILYAVWEADPKFVVTLETTAGGSVTGAGKYDPGARVQLTAAITDPNYYFVGWRTATGDIISRKQNYSYNINQDTSLTAVFAQFSPFSVGVQILTNGIADGTGGTVSGLNASYALGEEAVLQASPTAGYHFTGWYLLRSSKEIQISTALRLNYSVSANVVLVARFASDRVHTVTFLGKNQVPLSTVCVQSGDRLSLPDNAVANVPGYDFVGWFTEDVGGTAVTSNMIVEDDITAYARYSVQVTLYTISVEGGTVNSLSSVNLPYNTLAIIIAEKSAIPAGKVFSHWEKDGKPISYASEYVFAVSGNCTVRAVYTDKQGNEKLGFQIISSNQSNGSVYYTVERWLNDDVNLLEAGILITKDKVVAESENFCLYQDGVIRLKSIYNKRAGTTVQEVRTSPGTTLYARAYLRYIDAAGNIFVTYTDVVLNTVSI